MYKPQAECIFVSWALDCQIYLEHDGYGCNCTCIYYIGSCWPALCCCDNAVGDCSIQQALPTYHGTKYSFLLGYAVTTVPFTSQQTSCNSQLPMIHDVHHQLCVTAWAWLRILHILQNVLFSVHWSGISNRISFLDFRCPECTMPWACIMARCTCM